ncbi:MAG: NAD(P)H-dependent flavin oxidoreductase [Calditrichaceae bacterium]
MKIETDFTRHAGIDIPIICGAMYPCSNPELIAAVSDAGGIGIIQPLSMVYVHKHEFGEGIRLIKSLTNKPFGMNATIEKASKAYENRMREWVEIAIDEGVRFFVTALGNPKWVADMVHSVNGFVYHKVTERKWALKALEGGVDGLIAINNKAGGHAGTIESLELLLSLDDLNVPVVAGGGIGSEDEFSEALKLGYQGILMGTRFIATEECTVHVDYKNAIVKAHASDIVLTERVTGVPLSVIRTEYVDQVGTKAGPVARWMLQQRKLKKYIRLMYAVRSVRQLKKSALAGPSSKDYFQAGHSVNGISGIGKAGEIVQSFARHAIDDPEIIKRFKIKPELADR